MKNNYLSEIENLKIPRRNQLFRIFRFCIPMLFFCLAIVHASVDITQQNRSVTGKVVDTQGESVLGVSIVEQGTSNGTVTDMEGNFTLTLQGTNPVLVFSYVGYKTQRITPSGSTLRIILEEDTQLMDEVVVVGYGVQRKENLTGAVATVDVDKALGSKPVADITKSLQGITPGLTITYKSGNLGSDASINIRGVGTIKKTTDGNETAGEPLILVDGVPSDLTLINPDDVANISVLKDAASASIYGTRGAFGVVLITTKKGMDAGDKVKFSYSTNFSYSKPSNLVDFVDPVGELDVMMQASMRTSNAIAESFGMYHNILQAGIINWQEKYASSRNRKNKEMIYGEDWEIVDGRAYTYRIWDPHKEMLRDWTPQQTHNFSAQGRLGDRSSFLVSLGYVDQSGFMRINTDKMKRYNANISFNTQLTNWLRSSVGVLFTRKNHEEPFNYYHSSGTHYSGGNGYFGYYMRWGKYFPYGTYDGRYFRHAPGFMSEANMNNKQTDMLRLNATLTADITKDLQFIAEYSFSTENTDWNINGKPVQLLDFWSGGWNANDIIGSAYKYVAAVGSEYDKVAYSNSKNQYHVFNAYGTYSKKFDDHNLKVMVGTNIEYNEFRRFYAERRNVMNGSVLSDILLTTGSQYVTSSTSTLTPAHNDYSIAGFFGRINYDYQGKYLLEVNGRYDGSSRFPVGKLWGFFPSASVGYRISEEAFMESVRPTISDLKIRASVGSIGNQDVTANAFRAMMDITNPYWIADGAQVATVNSPDIVNRTLTWEKVITYDVGFDARFFNNRFGISFDWFQRENRDILAASKTLPSSIGTSAPLTNAGNLRTRGYEISVDFNYPINKNIMVYASAGLADYQTEVTKWDNQTKLLTQYYEGMKLGEIWGFETDRLFQASDFNADGSLVAGLASQTLLQTSNFKYGPGDVKYKDLDGDGSITTGDLTADNPGDLKVIGNTTPRYQYNFRLGANLYDFDIDIFFQGVGKRDYWAASDLVLPLYNRTDALYGEMMDYWTESNTDAYFPNPWVGHASNAVNSSIPGSNNFVAQSRYLLNMSYLRLKNLTVGYTLPVALTSRIGIDKVRVYFSGQNLFEFKSSRLPVDPEIDETEAAWGRTYPYPRTVSMGLQVNF